MHCPWLGEQYIIVEFLLPQLKKKYTFSPFVSFNAFGSNLIFLKILITQKLILQRNLMLYD